ncbi:MAG: nucleotidyltransferase family protein [Pseudomonadota bacterium]
MGKKPETAFILAAGKGTRMQPLTDTIPKPMVPLSGKPLIDHTIDALVRDDVRQIVVNLHHFGNKLENHLSARSDAKIIFSKESTLMDTGGGVRKAARKLGDDPFYIINGDAFWTEGPGQTALQRLADAWNPDTMDILILLQKTDEMVLTHGTGDYDIDGNGKAIRALSKTGQYMFTSIRIMKPEILRGTSEDPFSYLDLLDKAEKEGRLYALVHEGEWHHISTPDDLNRVNAALGQQGAA